MRTVKAWAVIGPDDFLMVQRQPKLYHAVYVDTVGNTKMAEELSVLPCTITITNPRSRK
jgi:hypothetical protein